MVHLDYARPFTRVAYWLPHFARATTKQQSQSPHDEKGYEMNTYADDLAELVNALDWIRSMPIYLGSQKAKNPSHPRNHFVAR